MPDKYPSPPPIPEVRLLRSEIPTPVEREWEHLPEKGLWRLTGPAGSGVTSALIDTVVARVVAGYKPDGVLFLTTTKEAASRIRTELSARLVAARPDLVVDAAVVRSVHSLAFALLRQHSDEQLRLITGAEQDAVIRELLAGHAEEGRGRWPTDYRPALTLVGFARQLRDFLLRAVERGETPDRLQELGDRYHKPMWVAAGDFLAEYQQVMRLSGRRSLSASELVTAVLDQLDGDPDLVAGRWHTVVVDDAQHLDPQSAELVSRLLATAELGVVGGDPDQAVFHFRGGRVKSLTAAHVDHEWRLPQSHRQPTRRVLVAATAVGERSIVVNLLRRAHLIDEVPWHDMAVVVRDSRSIDPVRRQLLAAGIPVHVNATDVVLSQQGIIASVILGIRALAEPLSYTEFRDLALGPIGGADPITLRRLLRGLRRLDPATPAMDTLVDLVIPGREGIAPERLAETLGPRELEVLDRLQRVLAAAGMARDRQASVEEVLWELWQATGLAERLTGVALRGGSAGSQADRDLDAMMALFDAAGDFVERRPSASIDSFIRHIAEQELPTGMRDRRVADPEAVTVLTAHGTVGRQWRRVILTGAQDDSWPSLGLTGTLFEQEEFLDLLDEDVDVGSPVDRITERLREEERLFHVATTRATELLTITAVDDEASAEPQTPSRFLADYCLRYQIVPESAEPGQQFSLLTPPALVAELRRVVCAPDTPDEEVTQAARQLARLAQAGVPGADPEQWWALTTPSDEAALREATGRITLSPSRIERISQCPLRSVLEDLNNLTETPIQMVRGTLIHAFTEAIQNGVAEQTARELVLDAFAGLLREPEWRRKAELEAFSRTVQRTADWLRSRAVTHQLYGTEVPVEVTVVSEGDTEIAIKGRIDRIDSKDANYYIVDFKSGTKKPTKKDAQANLQLAAYQLALGSGQLSDSAVIDGPDHPSLGGGLLVYPGELAKKVIPLEQSVKTSEELAELRAQLPELAQSVRGPRLIARMNSKCSTCTLKALCPVRPEGKATTDV